MLFFSIIGTQTRSNTQAYIGLVAGALAVVVLLLGCTGIIVVRRGRQKVALLTKHTALVTAKPSTIDMAELKVNLSGPVKRVHSNGKLSVKHDESDSETSSVYHEPYKLLPSAKQEYGCLLRKDALSSSKSGDYTGKSRLKEIMVASVDCLGSKMYHVSYQNQKIYLNRQENGRVSTYQYSS